MNLARVKSAIGVTRVARVTGLDRAGVEVACAIRPGGHVLQVSNGKGLAFDAAEAGAVLEAAELWASERIDPILLVHASHDELAADGLPAFAASEPGSAGRVVVPRLAAPSVRIAWREGQDLFSGKPVLVPAQAVHCPPVGAAPLGPIALAWTSNGMGAHPRREAALLHALLEAAERDQLARALPQDFTAGALRRTLLDPATLAGVAPRAAALREHLEQRRFRVYLLDLTPVPAEPETFYRLPLPPGEGRVRGDAEPETFYRHPLPSGEGRVRGDAEPETFYRHPLPPGEGRVRGDAEAGSLGLPVAGALLADPGGGPIPLTAGYACALDPDAALLGALLEAAQSRLTDIHGAREEVATAGREADAALAELCAGIRARRSARELPRPSARDRARGPTAILDRLRRAGFSRAAAVELAPPGLGLHVVKVVVPGLLVSELL